MKTRTAVKLILVGFLLLAAGHAVSRLSARLSDERLRADFLAEVRSAVAADVAVERVQLNVRGQLTITGLSLRQPEAEEPVFWCPRITVWLDRLELIKGRAVPTKVLLCEPVIRLAHNPQEGLWNVEGLRASGGKTAVGQRNLLKDGIDCENATVWVQSAVAFPDASPRPYRGIYLNMRPDRLDARRWRAEGMVTHWPLRGARLSGWFEASPQPDFSLQVECEALEADEALWSALPYCQDIWPDFHLRGKIAVSGQISLIGQNGLSYSLRADMAACSARTSYFPAEVRWAAGSVHVSDRDPVLVDLQGVVPSEQLGVAGAAPIQVRIAASYGSPNQGSSYRVDATDVPLCRTTIESIPSIGQELYARVRPEGTGHLTLTLASLPGDETMRYNAVIELQNATLKPVELPVPLQQVSGQIAVSNSGLSLANLHGVIAARQPPSSGDQTLPAARFMANGYYDFANEHTALDVAIHGLWVDQALVKAVPGSGEAIWEAVRPEGLLDAVISVRNQPGDSQLTASAVIQLRGGNAQLKWWPVPLQGLSGTVRVDPRGVHLENVRAALEPVGGPSQGASPATLFKTYAVANGHYDFNRARIAMDVAISNLWIDEMLIKAIPSYGEAIWEAVQPEGPVDATISMRAGPDEDEPSVGAIVRLRGLSARLKWWPLPLRDVSGTVRVDPGRIHIEGVSAIADLPGEALQGHHPPPRIAAHGHVDIRTDALDLQLEAGRFVLGRYLLETLGETGQSLWKAIRPTGLAAVRGRLYRSGAAEPLRYRLDLHLLDVSVVLEPVPVPVRSISGLALVTEQQTVVNAFSGLLCGGRLSGACLVRYSSKDGYGSYSVSLDFRQVELGELVRYLGGEHTELSGRLEGTLDVGGFLDQADSCQAKGHVVLDEGFLWRTPFFGRLLGALRLSLPGRRQSLAHGEMTFALAGGKIHVQEFEVTAGGLQASGYGMVGLDKTLKLTMVAVGAPEKGRGVPIVSTVMDWLLTAVERQLVRLDVSGTLDEPVFQSRVLSKVTWPLTTLRNVLFSPFLTGSAD